MDASGPTQSRFTSDQLGEKFADDWHDTTLWSRSIAHEICLGERDSICPVDSPPM